MSRWGLPGVDVPGDTTEQRPDRLLREGVLLLAGVGPGRRRDWWGHLAAYGPVPAPCLEDLAVRAAAADLRGFGGAAFPTAVKLRAAADRRAPIVVVNAMEGEHASAKDGVLLRHVPHLVLDGALIAARALGADSVTVRVAEDRPDLPGAVRAAAAERGDASRVTVSVGPALFAAGEATAVVNGVSGRTPLPAPLGRPPRTPSRVLPRPALVSNAETFARLALLARGLSADSALVTVSGAVASRGVVELPAYASLADAVWAVGGLTEPARAVVTGGWHGRWLPWTPEVRDASLTRAGVEAVGGRWGAGVVVLIAEALCPVDAVAAVAATLAAGSAGQCGPCHAGLPSIAGSISALGVRDAPSRTPAAQLAAQLADLRGAMSEVRGRGLCAHPTASVDALLSALDLFSDDISAHAAGRCVAALDVPVGTRRP